MPLIATKLLFWPTYFEFLYPVHDSWLKVCHAQSEESVMLQGFVRSPWLLKIPDRLATEAYTYEWTLTPVQQERTLETPTLA